MTVAANTADLGTDSARRPRWAEIVHAGCQESFDAFQISAPHAIQFGMFNDPLPVQLNAGILRAEFGNVICEPVITCQAAKCKRCGSRRRKYTGLIPHDMRRSAAKALRAAGVPQSVVMAMGGWKTAAMFRRYAIVSTADQRAAVEMLERARAERAATLTAEISCRPQ